MNFGLCLKPWPCEHHGYFSQCPPSHEPAEIWMLSDHTQPHSSVMPQPALYIVFVSLLSSFEEHHLLEQVMGVCFYICFKYTLRFCVWLRARQKNLCHCAFILQHEDVSADSSEGHHSL